MSSGLSRYIDLEITCSASYHGCKTEEIVRLPPLERQLRIDSYRKQFSLSSDGKLFCDACKNRHLYNDKEDIKATSLYLEDGELHERPTFQRNNRPSTTTFTPYTYRSKKSEGGLGDRTSDVGCWVVIVVVFIIFSTILGQCNW